MLPGLLDALVTLRAADKAAVLITPLAAARDAGVPQQIVEPHELVDTSALAPALRNAASEALREDRARTVQHEGQDYFVQPFNPPLRLIIVGAVHIAESLAAFATQSGYRVSIIEARSAFARPARFPGAVIVEDWPAPAFARLQPDARTSVVTLTHDPKFDDPALLAALASPAFYIGALGSRRTHAKRLERLAAAGVSGAQLERIHGPAGLPIGARSPAEIAISVLAQMTAVLRGTPAQGPQEGAAARITSQGKTTPTA